MAETSMTTNQDQEREVAHIPFAWHRIKGEGRDDAEFAAMTMDIAKGAVVIQEIIFQDMLDEECVVKDGDIERPWPRTISRGDSLDLMRMSIASLSLIHSEASTRIDRLNDLADKA